MGMNKGGTVTLPGLGVSVSMTDARHSSSFVSQGQIIYLGEAAGYVIHLDGGPSLYVAGDTCLFGDMASDPRLLWATLPRADAQERGESSRPAPCSRRSRVGRGRALGGGAGLGGCLGAGSCRRDATYRRPRTERSEPSNCNNVSPLSCPSGRGRVATHDLLAAAGQGVGQGGPKLGLGQVVGRAPWRAWWARMSSACARSAALCPCKAVRQAPKISCSASAAGLALRRGCARSAPRACVGTGRSRSCCRSPCRRRRPPGFKKEPERGQRLDSAMAQQKVQRGGGRGP